MLCQFNDVPLISETKPLLATEIEVQPLRYCQSDATDRSPAMYELREKVLTTVSFATAIRRKRILTVDHGSAICAYRLPGENTSQLLVLLARLSKVITSKEAAKRAAETRDAIIGLMESSLGDRMKDMIEISSLATAPEAQGRGYGTALVEAVIRLGDEQGRAVFLVTTDAYRFYEFVGFKLVGERQVAVDNPTWDGAPMLREPHVENVQEKTRWTL
ncbi:hypothetical protein V8D89_005687 [Ganoderma adspersum]